MTHVNIFSGIKDRTQLNQDIEKFIKNGGQVTELPDNEIRYTKEKVVRRGLHYAVHLPRISKDTGIAEVALKSLRRSMNNIKDCQLNTLYDYFKDRDLTQI